MAAFIFAVFGGAAMTGSASTNRDLFWIQRALVLMVALTVAAVVPLPRTPLGRSAGLLAAEPQEKGDAADNDLNARIATLVKRLGHDDSPFANEPRRSWHRLDSPLSTRSMKRSKISTARSSIGPRTFCEACMWSGFRSDDPPDLKKVLKRYGRQSPGERRSRMERVARLSLGSDSPAGASPSLRALCRMARFETDDELSEWAALLAMRQPFGDTAAGKQLAGISHDGLEQISPQLRDARAKQIELSIGNSRRPGSRWLRVYTSVLRNEADAMGQVDELIRELRTQHVSSRSHVQLVQGLSRWQVAQLRSRGDEKGMNAAIERSLELVGDSTPELLEAIDWLLECQAWQFVEGLAASISPSSIRSCCSSTVWRKLCSSRIVAKTPARRPRLPER